MNKTNFESMKKSRSLFIILTIVIVIAIGSIMWVGDKVGHGLYHMTH